MTVDGSPSPFPLKAGSPLPFGEGSGEPAFKGKNINVTTVNGIWPTADEKHIPFCLKAICSDAEAHRVIENRPSVLIRALQQSARPSFAAPEIAETDERIARTVKPSTDCVRPHHFTYHEKERLPEPFPRLDLLKEISPLTYSFQKAAAQPPTAGFFFLKNNFHQRAMRPWTV